MRVLGDQHCVRRSCAAEANTCPVGTRTPDSVPTVPPIECFNCSDDFLASEQTPGGSTITVLGLHLVMLMKPMHKFIKKDL